jgi:hypothetical protein
VRTWTSASFARENILVERAEGKLARRISTQENRNKEVMVKKLARLGLGKWVLGAAFIAGLNLLVASAHATTTTQSTILPGIAGQAAPSFIMATVTGNTPPGLGYKPGKDNNPGKDHKGGNGNNGNGGNGDPPPVTVPDTGTTLLLLGGAFLALALAGRKFKASPVTP